MLAEALCERRGAPVEVRVAERGDKRRLRELAERNAKLALDQDRLRREHRRQRRVEASPTSATRSGWRSCRCGSRASTSPTSAASTRSPRWSSSRAARPKKADYRRFRIRGERPDGPDDFASMEEVLWRRACAATSSRPTSRRTTASATRASPRCPTLILIDGGKGQLAAGMRALQPFVERGVDRDRPRQAARGGLRPGPLRRRSTSPPTRRPRSCCSGSATRPTASRSTTTAAAATGR